ncbi:NAD-dependent epimerase/dehydratase family protein [Gayadomonas joobiniege]|uniref:NAD-dependent epimerase/dehydratase family protein n=1 Tax=Gayadomonas joobiniege TaxID=1234606 RepID=UPI00036CEAF6|nr:NAD-dependent epimerase/dehydratase family protein [Gayadomonas joobiniege]
MIKMLNFRSIAVKILVLGGTGFIGRHIVQMCLENNHEVSVFSRGLKENIFPTQVKIFLGDRDFDIKALRACGEEWDVCIDLSGYTINAVNQSVSCFFDKIKHYVYISAIRVFKPMKDTPLTEESEKVEYLIRDPAEINNETYGRLKVSCEKIIEKIFKNNHTIIRPQVVVGAGDLSGRLAYWILRSRSNEKSLLPGDGTDYIQFVDVRDMSKFILNVIQNKIYGNFNLAGHRMQWSRFCEKICFNNGVWVKLDENELTFRELPLYRKSGTNDASFMNVCNKKALRNGLTLSDINSTIHSFCNWIEKCEVENGILPYLNKEHLSLEKELDIISKKRATKI